MTGAGSVGIAVVDLRLARVMSPFQTAEGVVFRFLPRTFLAGVRRGAGSAFVISIASKTHDWCSLAGEALSCSRLHICLPFSNITLPHCREEAAFIHKKLPEAMALSTSLLSHCPMLSQSEFYNDMSSEEARL